MPSNGILRGGKVVACAISGFTVRFAVVVVSLLLYVAAGSNALAGAEPSPEARPPSNGRLSVRIEEREAGQPAGVRSVDLYSRSFALIIGNDDYMETGWPRLSNAVRDARAVADALKAQGFEVSVRSNTTRAELVTALEDFVYAAGADPLARIVIWYAGHGHTIAGEGYLVPTDAPTPSEDASFRRNALSLRRFGEYMREIKSSHVLAVFDACFAGTVFDTARSPVSAVIGRATLMPVRQFISAGEADQQVSDDGSFRKLFIGALNGEEPRADANGDGYVTGSELGLFLEQRVTSITEGKQTPRSGKLRGLGFDRGDIVFDVGHPTISGRDRPAAAAAVAVPVQTPAQAPVQKTRPSLPATELKPEKREAVVANRAPPPASAETPSMSEDTASRPVSAPCRKAERSQGKIAIKAGDRLCSSTNGDIAVIKRITDKAVIYSVNGGYEQSCKAKEFCGFAWKDQLMFYVKMVHDGAAAGTAELLLYR